MAYATVEELGQALRVRVTVENTATLQACLDAAAAEIDHSLARPEDDPLDPADPLANRVNLLRAVEWFKSNDAAFGVLGFEDMGALRTPRDGFSRHALALMPLRRAWGLA